MSTAQRTCSIAERFWPKVAIAGPEDCWEWKRHCNELGYGKIRVGGRAGRPVSAHRVAWTLTFGPIPDGLWVLHHCDNPPCVNPAHLFLGTHADNMADMVAKGRARNGLLKGSLNGRAKLSPEQVEEIRRSKGVSQSTLARRYGVGQSTISRVLLGDSWAHVDPATAMAMHERSR